MEHIRSVIFGENGVICGTTEAMEKKLRAIGRSLGRMGTVGLGAWGGEGARLLARAAAEGIRQGGGTVLTHDMECAAQGAWLAGRYRLERSLFVEQDMGRLFLHIFDQDGLALEKGEEGALAEGTSGCDGPLGGRGRIQTGMSAYARDVVARGALPRFRMHTITAAVPGDSPADRALRRCLSLLGCRVTDHWQRGVPAFGAERGGLCLTAQDERGTLLESEQLLPVLCLIEMEHGCGMVAVPDAAGESSELVAAGFGGKCLRPGRDGEKARSLYLSQPWIRDAAFGAVRICSRMAVTGERLEELMNKTPRFSLRRRQVAVRGDREQVLQELARRHHRPLTGESLRIRMGNGWVRVTAPGQRQALWVAAESADMEVAAELCDFYVKQVGRADRDLLRLSEAPQQEN